MLSAHYIILHIVCRYQLFLQLKQDVLTGRLSPPHNVAVQLAALALQCTYPPNTCVELNIQQTTLKLAI